MIARCQAKTTLKSYWHELRDHQEYSKKIAMKTGTHTQVPVPRLRYNMQLVYSDTVTCRRLTGLVVGVRRHRREVAPA